MSPLWIARLATMTIVTVAAVTDIRERRAPLWLTAGGIAVGLLASLYLGREALVASAVGVAAGAGMLLPMVLLGWLGAGDALLLGAVGAWEGWHFALSTALIGSVAGGLLGLVALRLRKSSLPYVPAFAIGAFVSMFAP
jgi:Flp pilus assembly protein protease CpaA